VRRTDRQAPGKRSDVDARLGLPCRALPRGVLAPSLRFATKIGASFSDRFILPGMSAKSLPMTWELLIDRLLAAEKSEGEIVAAFRKTIAGNLVELEAMIAERAKRPLN
jgi:hypothetical protein